MHVELVGTRCLETRLLLLRLLATAAYVMAPLLALKVMTAANPLLLMVLVLLLLAALKRAAPAACYSMRRKVPSQQLLLHCGIACVLLGAAGSTARENNNKVYCL